jgi:hypothetical protein
MTAENVTTELAAVGIVGKAERVQAAANALLEGADRAAAADRVLRRVGELQSKLAELAAAMRAAKALAVHTDTSFDLSVAAKGYDGFARAASGLPGDTVFNRARNSVTKATESIQAEVTAEWVRWTRECLETLPLHRQPLLGEGDRESASRQERDLRLLARRESPSAGDISQFATTCDLLGESLAPIPDPPEAVLRLLDRLARGDTVRLGDLSDAQIAELRTAGLARQIELRRSRT